MAQSYSNFVSLMEPITDPSLRNYYSKLYGPKIEVDYFPKYNSQGGKEFQWQYTADPQYLVLSGAGPGGTEKVSLEQYNKIRNIYGLEPIAGLDPITAAVSKDKTFVLNGQPVSAEEYFRTVNPTLGYNPRGEDITEPRVLSTAGVNRPTAASSNFSDIINSINSLNRTAQQVPNISGIPAGANLEALSSANTGAALRGQIPPDVIRLLQQQAAERGVMGGYAGSPNEIAGYLRALGLTSLDLQERGEAGLTGATERSATTSAANLGWAQLTEQQRQADLENKRLLQQLAEQQRQFNMQQELARQEAARQAEQAKYANAYTAAQTAQVGISDRPGWMYTPPIPGTSQFWDAYYAGTLPTSMRP